ncbi:MAG: outer membrane protein assembly factor BamD [Bacteroidota bacterium]|nr:outer membrane protein assembly factor BamD [Bacteroidota bacterium]
MLRYTIFSIILLLFTSCGEFNKALKSEDVDYKQEVAEKYYTEKNWERAIPLLEELIVLRRGTAMSERVNYLHAMSTFGMKDYTLAAYYLANFVRTFPTSQYAEEAAFLSAYCYYRNSPNYELDQGDTRNAIDQLQLFMVRYPTTSLRDSCNALIDVLRTKLEVKAYHAADQYYRMENFQAAGVAYRSFVRDWPNSRFREDAMLHMLKADHRLALNSVEDKRLDRVQEAIRSYHNFADAFPQSAVLSDANRMHRELNAMLTQQPLPLDP